MWKRNIKANLKINKKMKKTLKNTINFFNQFLRFKVEKVNQLSLIIIFHQQNLQKESLSIGKNAYQLLHF